MVTLPMRLFVLDEDLQLGSKVQVEPILLASRLYQPKLNQEEVPKGAP